MRKRKRTEVPRVAPEQRMRQEVTGSCTTVAIAQCLGVTWVEAREELERDGAYRSRGDTTGANSYRFCTLSRLGFVHVYEIVQFLALRRNLSWRGLQAPPAMTVASFCRDNPTGTYYLEVKRHSLAVINGVVQDYTRARSVVQRVYESPRQYERTAWRTA